MNDPSHHLHDLEAVITADVERSLAEDVGSGDLTAQLIPDHASASACVITRVDGVLSGTEWFSRTFMSLDPDVEIYWHAKDGDAITAGQPLCEIAGNARAMLTAERSALNFLQTLSAVATKTRQFVHAIEGTKARVYDTRKTLPGLRTALKYAVRCGGGHNHRMGLYDGLLIKENHIAAAGGIASAMNRALSLAQQSSFTGAFVQIEVESLMQLHEALSAGAKLILLDNFSIDQLRVAVAECTGRAELEASGGVNLESIREVAATGVDRISVGTLTKDIVALDLSMRFKHH